MLDSTAIHQAAFISDTDPGVVGKRKFWIDTSGGAPFVLKVRNEADDDWDVVGADSAVAALSDLSDVDLTGLTSGDFLKWDGTHWVPDVPAGGGGGSGSSYAPVDDVGGYTHASADEFATGSTLDVAWVTITALGGSNLLKHNADPFSKSCLGVRFDGSGSGDVLQIRRPYTPPGTAKSLTAKFFGEVAQDFHDLEAVFYNSSNDDAVSVVLSHATHPIISFRTYTGYSTNAGAVDMGAVTLPDSLAIGGPTVIYLHLQSDGSGNWSAWYARSGMDPVKLVFTSSFALTPDSIAITIGGYGSTAKKQLACDWIRPDFVTL